FYDISNLEVFFAGLGSDADTIIEDKIKANTAPRRLTVVSSDRRVQSAARARKATAVKSIIFWNDLCKRLSHRKKTPREPAAKREGLTESETEHWLKIFGLQ
ncbi:MAG: NYN domain-containing protein, partial [Planctomycetota bacterium]